MGLHSSTFRVRVLKSLRGMYVVYQRLLLTERLTNSKVQSNNTEDKVESYKKTIEQFFQGSARFVSTTTSGVDELTARTAKEGVAISILMDTNQAHIIVRLTDILSEKILYRISFKRMLGVTIANEHLMISGVTSGESRILLLISEERFINIL